MIIWAAIAAGAAPARAAVAPAAKAPTPTGDLEVTVATADGKPFSGVLYAGEQALAVESGKERQVVRKLAVGRTAVTADLKVGQGPGKPDLRYIGVAEGFPNKDQIRKVTVTAQPVKDIDAFCSRCHPYFGEPVQRGQIVRDIHVSNREMRPEHLAQLEKYKVYVEKIRQEGKVRPPEPILVEERVVIVKGKEVVKTFFTCESCHTLHWKTPWRSYSRAVGLETGELCGGCHL